MKYITLLAMTLGFVVVQLDVTVVNVATRSIGSSIGGSITGLQWVVNAYTLSFASIILTAGAMGDRLGAKRIFIAGFSIFTIASLGCALSPSLPTLIAARALQGIGASILVPCSLALLNHAYEEPGEKAHAVAIWAAGASVALALGPIIGGLLIHSLGWRSIFYINLPLGCLGIWLTLKYAKETTATRGRSLDLKGQLAAILSLVLLAASLIQGGKQGWGNERIIFGFVLFGIFFTVFLVIESNTGQPMMPLSMFRNKTFSATSAIGFLINIAFYGLIFIISLYFQQVRNYSPLKTGLCFLPTMIAVFVANIIAPRSTALLGAKWVIIIGALIFLVSCLLLSSIDDKTNFSSMAPLLAAMGFGVGLIVPPMTSAILGSVDKTKSGIASGVLNSMRQTGSVVGVALFGSLIARRGHFLAGLHLSLFLSAAVLLLATISAFRISGARG